MILQKMDPHLQQNLSRSSYIQKSNSSFWKSLTLGVMTSFSALAFSYFYYQFVSSSIEQNIFLLLALLALFAMLFLFQVLFIYDFKTAGTFILVESILLWGIFLYETDLGTSLIGLSITILMFYLAFISSRIYMEKLIQISFFRVGVSMMKIFITGIALFLIMGYISIGLSGSTSIVSRSIFAGALSSSSSIVTRFYPGFSFEESLRDNIEVLTLQTIGRDTRFSEFTPEQKQIFLNQTILNYENKVAEFVGTPVDSRKQLSEVLYSILSLKIENMINVYGSSAYIMVVLIVALILRGLSPIFYWPLLFASFIVFQLLLAFGVIELLLENHSKEILRL